MRVGALSYLSMQLFNNTNLLSPEVQGVLTLLFMAVTLALFYYIMLQMTPKKVQEDIKVKTVLKCLGSGKITERDFQKGDFVGKIVGECEDKSQMIIDNIYSVSSTQNKPKKRD